MHEANSDMCKQSPKVFETDSTFLHYNGCSSIFSKSNSGDDVCSDCYLHKNICKELQVNCALFRISMLDFAHVFSSSEEDSNYLFGLNRLITNWQQLLKTSVETFS